MNNRQVTTLDDIRYAFSHSTVRGVLALIPNEIVCVPAARWQIFKDRISELCGYKWVHKREIVHGIRRSATQYQ